MSDFKPSACKRCGASIVWATNKNERRMPFDFFPVDAGDRRGTFILFVEFCSTDVQARTTRDFEPALLPLYRDRYVPHFVTCTGAST